MAKNAKDTLLEFKAKLDPMIEEFFDEYLEENDDLSEDAKFAINVLKDYTVKGGKRLRGALMYYGYQLLGGEDMNEVLRACIFIEIIHSYILIEDDVMDKAEIRRNHKTPHEIYRELNEKIYKVGDPVWFGYAIAINVGMIGSHLAMQYLSELDFPADRKVAMLSKINDRLVFTGFGQIQDILSEVKPNFTQEDAMLVHRWKTATYTYELPLHAGAVLTGADFKDLELLSSYAIPAGIAFQLQDDILGLYADEKKLGKPIGTDITEGKRTILILKALEKGTKSQRDFLESVLGKPKITRAQLDEVRTILKDTGSYQYAKNLAQDYVDEALQATKKMKSWNPEGREFLEGIAEYMINRDL